MPHITPAKVFSPGSLQPKAVGFTSWVSQSESLPPLEGIRLLTPQLVRSLPGSALARTVSEFKEFVGRAEKHRCHYGVGLKVAEGKEEYSKAEKSNEFSFSCRHLLDWPKFSWIFRLNNHSPFYIVSP